VATILLVDDDPAARYAMRRALELVGHTVMEAADGQEALALHRVTPADVVVTDILMPNKDGLELIEAIKRMNANTPVIACTAQLTHADRFLFTAREIGANKTLTKPFTAEVLLATVQLVTRKRPPAQS
jgi:CheY-like chemotaxis protein